MDATNRHVGIVNINLESRSDQPLQITSDSNNSNLILDNENPVIIDSYPKNQDYIDNKENRDLSILLADTSGFITDQVSMEVWVQSLDDGSDGSLPDEPQENEYREINFTLENLRVTGGSMPHNLTILMLIKN